MTISDAPVEAIALDPHEDGTCSLTLVRGGVATVTQHQNEWVARLELCDLLRAMAATASA